MTARKFYFILTFFLHFLVSNLFMQSRITEPFYNISSEFGNLTKDADNETSIGAVKIFLKERISSFSVCFFKTIKFLSLKSFLKISLRVKFTDEDKTIATHTINPCDPKSYKKFRRFVSQVVRPQKLENVLSFVYSCPWEEASIKDFGD